MHHRKLEHSPPSEWCPKSPLMHLLFNILNLTVPRSFACPTVLLVIHFIKRGHIVYSTMKSLCYTCCTHSKKGMKSRGCKSVKCQHASSLNLASPVTKASIRTCLWRVCGSGFSQPSVKWFTPPGKHRRKTIYVWSSEYLSPSLGIYGKTWYLSTIRISLILSQRPSTASNEHILIQVMLRHHGKMTVFVLKHSPSSLAAKAFKYKKRWFWVGIKCRSGFI